MKTSSFYPVIATPVLAESRDFYLRNFGFSIVFESDWYVSLKNPSGYELALLDPTHPTIPAGYRVPAQGVLLNFEVDDVDGEWRRLVVEGGLTPELELRSEDFGQRHFIVAAPEGVLIDVITEIPWGSGS
ncbi:glyoxalase/bleomycin resistance/extradiol dioxygenase family protein [Herbidospora galbida]|uniref:Glyoxalase/bleomycin resistance/extradiol dioxygenase family protein n=1 Tax=Herbidospora galbida TaxID=2575442 RepID=A0A4U3MA13_9ACTN|nr:VOC family protein [Herbidospora galbida]TKK85139.1 glyoxalase/bleomycin resistance/extradiol dioxygenase family protein [Herbidospora galbida]